MFETKICMMLTFLWLRYYRVLRGFRVADNQFLTSKFGYLVTWFLKNSMSDWFFLKIVTGGFWIAKHKGPKLNVQKIAFHGFSWNLTPIEPSRFFKKKNTNYSSSFQKNDFLRLLMPVKKYNYYFKIKK